MLIFLRRGSDNRNLLSGDDSEIDVVQDGAILLIGEADMFKADFTVAGIQRPGIRAVGDFGFPVEYIEHQVHVGECMF